MMLLSDFTDGFLLEGGGPIFISGQGGWKSVGMAGLIYQQQMAWPMC
jgi:hypothetical protein